MHLLEVSAFETLLSVERSGMNFAPNEVVLTSQSCLEKHLVLLGPLFKLGIQRLKGIRAIYSWFMRGFSRQVIFFFCKNSTDRTLYCCKSRFRSPWRELNPFTLLLSAIIVANRFSWMDSTLDSTQTKPVSSHLIFH